MARYGLFGFKVPLNPNQSTIKILNVTLLLPYILQKKTCLNWQNCLSSKTDSLAGCYSCVAYRYYRTRLRDHDSCWYPTVFFEVISSYFYCL